MGRKRICHFQLGVKVVVKPTDFKANEIIFEEPWLKATQAAHADKEASSIKIRPHGYLKHEPQRLQPNSDITK